ncbi:hypothetical protein BD408DRAFT_70570 [Parasitella parasitica]|nr:hypothetical protein BD408DRAFT_70570 [Parasitella parasitica]
MPCLGSRKKSNNSRQQSIDGQSKTESSAGQQSEAVAQIKLEYNELKSKNMANLEIIAKQTSELEQLRQQLSESITSQLSIPESNEDDRNETKQALLKLEAQNKETLSTLAEKEALLEKTERQLQELTEKMNREKEEAIAAAEAAAEAAVEAAVEAAAEAAEAEAKAEAKAAAEAEEAKTTAALETASTKSIEQDLHNQLAEKEQLLQKQQAQLEELKSQWEAERAELSKPALEQVTAQLEELRETNKAAVERLTEKENELAELRSQLNRRDRKPKQSLSKEQEQQRRLNRLTMDLENDRLLIQRLDELNQQLETQKQKHESILQSHAKALAEKDHVLFQHQKSLKQLKMSHDNATKSLEQGHLHQLKKLQLQHENALSDLKKRLAQAENQAKSAVNDELDQILVEFEQSQHNHSAEVASLQQSYETQISKMRLGQQAEIRSLIGDSSDGNAASKLKNNAKFSWPPVAV